jgi:hypothetical protein
LNSRGPTLLCASLRPGAPPGLEIGAPPGLESLEGTKGEDTQQECIDLLKAAVTRLLEDKAAARHLEEKVAGLSRTTDTRPSCQPMGSAVYETWPEGTTVMLKNLPPQYTRDMLKELLQSEGFLHHCNFLYLPMNFQNSQNVGYSFVNLTSEEQARRFFNAFEGFRSWVVDSDQAGSVCWSNVAGLRANIERYRNSPIMRSDVPEPFKPILLSGVQELPLPDANSKQMRRLRSRKNHGLPPPARSGHS